MTSNPKTNEDHRNPWSFFYVCVQIFMMTTCVQDCMQTKRIERLEKQVRELEYAPTRR